MTGAKAKDKDGRLPLHLSCEKEAPIGVVQALLAVHPDGEAACLHCDVCVAAVVVELGSGHALVKSCHIFDQVQKRRTKTVGCPFMIYVQTRLLLQLSELYWQPILMVRLHDCAVVETRWLLRFPARLSRVRVRFVCFSDMKAGAKARDKDNQLPLHHASSASVEVTSALQDVEDGWLSLRLTCAKNASIEVVSALLSAYPDGEAA